MAFRRVFFSAAPTAQNSPKLHFRFINYIIQPSRVGSLRTTDTQTNLKYLGKCATVVTNNLVLGSDSWLYSANYFLIPLDLIYNQRPQSKHYLYTMRTNLLNWCNLVSRLFGGKNLLIFS